MSMNSGSTRAKAKKPHPRDSLTNRGPRLKQPSLQHQHLAHLGPQTCQNSRDWKNSRDWYSASRTNFMPCRTQPQFNINPAWDQHNTVMRAYHWGTHFDHQPLPHFHSHNHNHLQPHFIHHHNHFQVTLFTFRPRHQNPLPHFHSHNHNSHRHSHPHETTTRDTDPAALDHATTVEGDT